MFHWISSCRRRASARALFIDTFPTGPLKADLERHLHEDHILPETAGDSQMTAVEKQANMFVLRHLAGRAALGADPLKGMAKVYFQAFKRASSVGQRLRNRG